MGFVRERAEEDVAEGAVGAPQAEDLAVRQRVAIGRGGEARLARAGAVPDVGGGDDEGGEGRRGGGHGTCHPRRGWGARARGRQGEGEKIPTAVTMTPWGGARARRDQGDRVRASSHSPARARRSVNTETGRSVSGAAPSDGLLAMMISI